MCILSVASGNVTTAMFPSRHSNKHAEFLLIMNIFSLLILYNNTQYTENLGHEIQARLTSVLMPFPKSYT